MRNAVRFLFCVAGLLFASTGIAFAAPPASCAGKFIGGWTVHILATGQSYPAVISPGGTTHQTCPMCTPTATWTCNGNTITIFVNGITVSHTLAPDGRSMSGSGATLTRIGAAPAAATQAPQQQANNASTENKKSVAEKKTAEQQKPAAPINSVRKSASCSDITGTSDTSVAPTSQQCKDANAALHAARVTRAKYPLYAEEQYKKAAAAARAAGDTQLELSILREATSPPAPEPPAEDTCAEPAREAASYITGAEAIKAGGDLSCEGWLQAAENYFAAGKIFFRAIKPGLTQEQIAASCAYRKSNEMFRLRDALLYDVDRRREAGGCQPRPPGGQTSPPPTGGGMPPDQCKADMDGLNAMKTKIEAQHDKDQAALDALLVVDVKVVELAARGCPHPPFGQLMCERAWFYWRDKEHVPESEIAARLKAGGCPDK